MRKLAAMLAVSMAVFTMGGCSSSQNTETVSVESVASITGIGNVGVTDKFNGLIVSEDEVKVEKNAELTVAEVKVEAGDEVKEGDVLFTYDTDNLQLTLDKQNLELEQLKQTIESKEAEIKQLEKEKKSASSADKLEYTIEIQTAQADIREAEYNIKAKEADIKVTEASLENADVVSPIDGRVKSVQSSDSSSEEGTEADSSAFITLIKIGDYRVKGTINELSVGALSEGMPLLIRSRVDKTQTWTGTLEKIDWENTVQNNNYYYSDSDEETSSTKYPFYVVLDSQDGLMLGQHVYIETNVSGEEEEEVLSLPSYYIVDADSDPYVWAESSKGKLEQRKVTLGAYDEDMDEYEILDGLTEDDYIAFPSEDCVSGAATEHYDMSGGDASGDGEVYDEGGTYEGGEVYDEGGAYEDGEVYDEGGAYEDEEVYTDEGGAAADAYTEDGTGGEE